MCGGSSECQYDAGEEVIKGGYKQEPVYREGGVEIGQRGAAESVAVAQGPVT